MQRFDQEPGLPKRASALRVVGAIAFAAVCFMLVWLLTPVFLRLETPELPPEPDPQAQQMGGGP